MANQLEKAITVKEAIDKIDNGDFLIPSIQRRFVWEIEQIEMLFDSIMQGYPINTFMFWQVKDDKIKNSFRFYDFLNKYYEYKGGNNEERKTRGYKDFEAIIDGQQRLNSLYIGLKGSYAEKHYIYRKKYYYNDESCYPSRKLYLDLLGPLENDEQKKKYDFRFLVNNNYEKENENKRKSVIDFTGETVQADCYWFEVGRILEFKNEHEIVSFLLKENLDFSGFPGSSLLSLFKLVNDRPIINYYLEADQDFDKILYEFIRTNDGGTKLSFADLLMSIISASWEKSSSISSARDEIDKVTGEIRRLGFTIDQDFVLKTCLVLLSSDVKFLLKNFDNDLIESIKRDWGKITLCINAAFELIESLSFNDYSLRAKNAAIPIILYLYKTGYYSDINKDNSHKENRYIIKKYLNLSLLNKVFGGSTDGFIAKLKKIILASTDQYFPLSEIKKEFSGTNRSFGLDDDRIKNILRVSYDSLDSFYTLSILFEKFKFEFKDPNVDHMHPKAKFCDEMYDEHLANDEEVEFYKNHFNTVLNLSLLSEEQNKSKSKSDLDSWIAIEEKLNPSIRDELFIPKNIDLSWDNFIQFIDKREILLTERLKEKVSGD